MSTTKPLCTHYDPSADAATFLFQRHAKSARTEVLDDRRMVDYDFFGKVAFVEVLDVSHGVELEGLPEPALIRQAVDNLAAQYGWKRA